MRRGRVRQWRSARRPGQAGLGACGVRCCAVPQLTAAAGWPGRRQEGKFGHSRPPGAGPGPPRPCPEPSQAPATRAGEAARSPAEMLLRLRTRDGTERLEVPDDATVAELQRRVEAQLSIPAADQTLSLNQGLVRWLLAASPQDYKDLSDHSRSLKALGVQHGCLVFLRYTVERTPSQSYQPPPPFGAKMTVDELVAKQVRISRQESSAITSVSFDRHAANTFQAYAADTLGFTIKRCGMMYGTEDEATGVSVAFIYEPPQEGSPTDLLLLAATEEEQRVQCISNALGLKRVGWIVTQSSSEREQLGEGHTLAASDVARMARFQSEYGKSFVTAVVSCMPGEQGPQVHFEAFQVSDQAVQLAADGWFVPSDNPKVTKMKAPVMIAIKDVTEVDNDYFLVPIKILDHAGPLTAAFPVENRLIAQTGAALKSHLQRAAGRPYVERLSDFHLLLFLSQQLDRPDVALLADAVRQRSPIQEGYQYIINGLAGL